MLPGVSDRVTVLGNHCSKFIASPYARTGILENNPIHTDMKSAAEQAGLQYIVNVIIDEDKRVVMAFAGDPFIAHEAGCEFLKQYCRVKAVPADIVITGNGGAPLDQNMNQCVKSITAAEASAGDDGVIILCAECLDGTGGDGFYHAMRAVSYTHLDVYKRQALRFTPLFLFWNPALPAPASSNKKNPAEGSAGFFLL